MKSEAIKPVGTGKIEDLEPEMLIAALLGLYNRQETDEQAGEYTAYQNGMGFNNADAGILSSISSQIIRRKFISEKQFNFVKSKLPKYHKQIESLDLNQFKVEGLSIGASTEKKEQPKKKELQATEHGSDSVKLSFDYDPSLISKIKAISGRRYFSKGEDKFWTIPKNPLNIKKAINIGFALSPGLLALLDTEKSAPVSFEGLRGTLWPYQVTGATRLAGELNLKGVLADEMGCIDGNATVKIRWRKTTRTMTLSQFYEFFHKKKKEHPNWGIDIRALCNEHFAQLPVKNVLDSGIKEVIKLSLKSGKSLVLTPEHEVLTPNGWVQAQNLKREDSVITNGHAICRGCGKSAVHMVENKYSKFYGFCFSCMYARRGTKNKIGYRITKDGYKNLVGKQYRDHPNWRTDGLPEHVFVMTQHIGKSLEKGMCVHHKDGNRLNNKLDNLELMTFSEHCKTHAEEKIKHLWKDHEHRTGSSVVMTPKADSVVSVSSHSPIRCYDVVLDHVTHNFVANGIVVHNCGKTAQALAAIYARREECFPVLVLCPSIAKYVWEREAKTWCPTATPIVLSGYVDFDNIVSNSYPIASGNEITIVNYDVLADQLDQKAMKAYGIEHKIYDKKDIPEIVRCYGWGKILKKMGYKTILMDESHKLKNDKSNRTKEVKKLVKGVSHVVAISGTPIENRPKEFFPILEMICPHLFGTWWTYAHRYCNPTHNGFGWDFNGASNTEELNTILTESVMIRRLKKDVLKDLPEKVRSVIPVEIDMTEYNKAETALRSYLQESTNTDAKSDKAVALAQIERCKQAAVVGKLDAAIEWIQDYLETGKKLVVFAHHTFVLDKLEKKFKDICVRIDGSVSVPKRREMEDAFQMQDNIKLFLGNIKAAGVAITLTAASDTLTLELGWMPGEHDQAEDRVHRFGQEAESVTAYYLVARGTIEERIAEMLDQKRNILSQVLDGKDAEDVDLLTELLKQYGEK